MSTNASASEEHIINNISVTQMESEGYVLVSKDEFVDDESGYLIVDETYLERKLVTYSNETPPISVKRSRAVYVNPSINYGDLLFIMWVEGTFYWDGKTATVSGAKRWLDQYKDEPKVTEKSFESESDQGSNFLFGNKYAYIEYIVQTENGVHFTKDFRLWVDVNRKGDIHVDN